MMILSICWLTLLASFCCQTVSAQKIVVVGAGVSGLSAAHHLCGNSLCDITILEAENRIGGRIHTMDFRGHLVEEGAQWIHGFRGNPVYQFLAGKVEMSIQNYGINARNEIYRSSGNSTDVTTRRLFLEAMELSDEISEYISERRKTVNFRTHSLLDVAETVWIEKLQSQGIPSTSAVIDAIFNYNVIEWSLYDGGHASEMGALAYYYFRDFYGPDMVMSGGYETLLNFLTDDIPKSSIKLQREVKSIKWNVNDSLAANSGNSSIGPVLIEYEGPNGNRETMSADHVIVTVSLGYLKKHHLDLFTPNLPLKKQNAISKLQFGSFNKIVLYYDKKFWKQGDFPIHLLWDSDKTVAKFGEDYRIFKELNLIGDYKDNFIFVFANKHVSNIIQDLSDSEVGEAITRLLRKVMKNDTIPFPDDMFVTRWGEKKHFLGSYSYTGIGETRATKRFARDPLVVNGVPRVLFAGEAMHNSRFSTVDGAFASGKNEANRLIQFLNGQ